MPELREIPDSCQTSSQNISETLQNIQDILQTFKELKKDWQRRYFCDDFVVREEFVSDLFQPFSLNATTGGEKRKKEEVLVG